MNINTHPIVRRLTALFVVLLVSTSCCPKLINLTGKSDFTPKVEKLRSVIFEVNMEQQVSDKLNSLMGEADSIMYCPCKNSDGNTMVLLKFDALTPIEIESRVAGVKGNTGQGRQGGPKVNFSFGAIEQFDDFSDTDRKYTIPVYHQMESQNVVGFTDIDLDSIPILDSVLDKLLNSVDINSLIVDQNTNPPIIAVLDTGLDPVPFKDSKPFLFNSRNLPLILSDLENKKHSGWNFVANNNNVYDDNTHGTFVTKVIHDKLSEANTEFSILPLKILDEKGQGTYWNVVCAMSYLSNIQNATNNLKIINTSFGGVMKFSEYQNEFSLYNDLLERLEPAINVSSAGNKDDNNNEPETFHFPSNLGEESTVAVGGYDVMEGPNVKHPDSNYGDKNVDVATAFNGYVLKYKRNYQKVEVSGLEGTSYGAAFISAVLLKYLETLDDYSADQNLIKEFLDTTATESSQLKELDQIKEGYYIIK